MMTFLKIIFKTHKIKNMVKREFLDFFIVKFLEGK